jgi:cytochrome P450
MIRMARGDASLNYPFNGNAALDLDPVFARLRRDGLVQVQPPFGGPVWLATTHEDVCAVLEDRTFRRRHEPTDTEPRLTERTLIANSLPGMDGAEHSRLRRALVRWFNHSRIERLRSRAEQVTESLLDGMQRSGPPADLVADLAKPLTVAMINEIIGVPVEDQPRIAAAAYPRQASGSRISSAQIAQAGDQIQAYFAELVARRRESPGEDSLSGMLRDARDGGVTDAEAVSLAGVIIAGGYETTAARLGSMAYALLTHPAAADRFRDDPASAERAIEELLRFTTLGYRMRSERATRDVEVGGVCVHAGESIMPSRSSASRDESVYDDPDRLDLDRGGDHLAFGRGRHYCPGAPLARLELRVALTALWRRFPDLRLSVPADQVPWGNPLLWAPHSVPVTW